MNERLLIIVAGILGILFGLLLSALVYGALAAILVYALAFLGLVKFSWVLVAGVAAVIMVLAIVFG